MKDSHSFDPGSNPGTSTPVLPTIVRNEVLSFPERVFIDCRPVPLCEAVPMATC